MKSHNGVQQGFSMAKEAAPESEDGEKPEGAPEPKKDEARYSIAVIRLRGGRFFETRLVKGKQQLVLNSEHAFYRLVYEPAGSEMRRHLELLLLSHAKAEADGAVEGLVATWAADLAAWLEGDA